MAGQRNTGLPGQNDFFTGEEWSEVVEGAKFDGRRVTERLGPKVELALLVGHEAGRREETGPGRQRRSEAVRKRRAGEPRRKTRLGLKLAFVSVGSFLRGWGEDLFLWRQLVPIQVENHLLLAEVQQKTDGVS